MLWVGPSVDVGAGPKGALETRARHTILRSPCLYTVRCAYELDRITSFARASR